jgi:hypothetical protein
LLNLSTPNIIKINTLLSKKIKGLKNEDLDCGNGLSFFVAARNLIFITGKGLSFHYERKQDTNGSTVHIRNGIMCPF